MKAHNCTLVEGKIDVAGGILEQGGVCRQGGLLCLFLKVYIYSTYILQFTYIGVKYSDANDLEMDMVGAKSKASIGMYNVQCTRWVSRVFHSGPL